MQNARSTVDEPGDLAGLAGHRESVQAGETLEEVHKRFAKHEFEFMAVLDGTRIVGLCSRRQIGMILGARFGFAIHSSKPITDYLVKDTTFVRLNEPISRVLTAVFSRPDETLFDDVVLVDREGSLMGLIFSRTLVRLQNSMLLDQISQLETTQREINQKNEQMEEDLRLAREIQLAMLPDRYPVVPEGAAPGTGRLEFCHRFLPAGVVSGDFFHIVRVSDHAAGVFICDVMGHGVRSAFVTAMLRTLAEELSHLGADPGQLLTRMNAELRVILKQTASPFFATACYLVADTATRKLRFARAGHPDPFHLCRQSAAVHPLQCAPKTAGPALGLFPAALYGSTETDFDPGDVVILFTDGIYEAFNERDEEFGTGRLADAIAGRATLPLPELLDGVLADVRTFVGARGVDDDVCFVGMEFAAICGDAHS
jgi:sigma-B regulation protein RsbU (phosphoserine phosphatase)